MMDILQRSQKQLQRFLSERMKFPYTEIRKTQKSRWGYKQEFET
jgi:hypothetical protein